MTRYLRAAGLCVLALVLMSGSALVAQGRGAGADGGGPAGGPVNRTRLQVLTDAFTLDKTQKQHVKEMMDAAFKGAAPQRADLVTTRTALGQALAGAKPDAEIAAAVKAYSEAAAAMTAVEMKTLAAILAAVSQEQRTAGTNEAFYMMRGALAGKKWDQTPDSITY